MWALDYPTLGLARGALPVMQFDLTHYVETMPTSVTIPFVCERTDGRAWFLS
jgi:hypothetical protein